jgi:hypothetical protein
MLLDIKKNDVIYFSVFFSVLLQNIMTVAMVMLPGPSLYLQLFIIGFNLLNKELKFLWRLLP